MHIAWFVDFKPTGRVKKFGGGKVEWKPKILYFIFDAINRPSQQPTKVNIIFSSH